MLDFFAGCCRLFSLTFYAAFEVGFFRFVICVVFDLIAWGFFWLLARGMRRI